MNRVITLVSALVAVVFTLNAQTPLSIKDITSGKFGTESVRAVNPLDDGESYAQIKQGGKQIVTYSFKTGKETGVLFDVNNCIGSKISRLDNYSVSPDGKRLLIQTKTQSIYRRSFKAEFYIYTIANKKLEPLSENGLQQTPIWSPDGQQIAFVRDNNIFLVKLLYDNAEIQVTKDGEFNKIINGIPDWVYEEEFGYNSAMTFTADGSMICWVRFDETNVKTYALQLFKGDRPAMKEYADYPGEYAYKYPKAGFDNSKVTAWSYDIKSRQTRQIQLPLDADGYIPRIKSTSDSQTILLYTMNRHQDVLNIYAANPRSTVCRLLIKESVPKYVPEDVLEESQITDNHILLPSDRSGKMQLYLYDLNGTLQKKLTDDKYIVTKVYGYDEQTGNVYYQAVGGSPINKEIYVTDKKGKTTCLSRREGVTSAIFSKNFKYFLSTWSDSNTPYRYSIYNNSGKELQVLVDNKALQEKREALGFTKCEFFTFKTSEGVELNGYIFKPADFDPNKKYPVIMHQYSGPGSQQVVNSWSVGSMSQGGLFDQYFNQHGFITVGVDGRGTGGRGAEFEKCTYLKLGELEAKDQVETAIYLGTLPYVDKERIGIWGWSFGGFCTLMSMSEGREVFRAGVAIAAPTNWKYYDTVYTERFMRTPQENPSGYDINPIKRAPNLHGALLLCHGLTDDNVHPQNAFEYSEALVQSDKDFKELIYTNRNHSIFGGNTRNHLLRQVADFFERELK